MNKKRTGVLFSILNLAVVLICFQNCSEMTPSEELVEQLAILEQERQISAGLQDDDSLLFWKNPNGLASLSLNQVVRLATQWSVVAYIKPGPDEVLFKMTPGEDYEIFEVKREAGKLVFSYVNDSENSVHYDLPLSSTEPHVVGFSFGPTIDVQMFYVDGRYIKLTRRDVGTPLDFMSLDRDLSVSEKLGEFLMFSRTLNGLETNSLSRTMGRAWGMGELPFDIGPDVPKVEVYVPSPEFLAALELIKGKCVSCHDHGVWAGYNNEKQFLKSLANGSKLVTPGDLAASELYRRAALPSSDPDRMPEAPNAALTTAELAILSNWILNFGTTRPAATPTPTPGGTPTPTPTPVGTPAPTPTPLSPEALRFNQAKNILLGRSCMVCHSAWAGQNEAFFKTTMTVSTANNAFPIEPLVVAGNPDGSAIMRRIVTTLPVADRMPRGYPALSTSDIAVLRNWIQNMQ